MYLVINKWVITVKVSNFSGHYLRNRSTLGIGVLGYMGIVWPKEHSPEVWHIPPGTPCIYMYIYIYIHTHTHKHIYKQLCNPFFFQTSERFCPWPKIINYIGVATQTVPVPTRHPVQATKFISLLWKLKAQKKVIAGFWAPVSDSL